MLEDLLRKYAAFMIYMSMRLVPAHAEDLRADLVQSSRIAVWQVVSRGKLDTVEVSKRDAYIRRAISFAQLTELRRAGDLGYGCDSFEGLQEVGVQVDADQQVYLPPNFTV